MSEVLLELKNLSKKYQQNNVLWDINLNFFKDEFVSLLGPSGCGKSTLLKIIAGVENLSSGTILLGGREIQNTPSQHRPTNMVFQNFALFPHLSVWENLAFGPKVRGLKPKDFKSDVENMLLKLNLTPQGRFFPHQLSGGQKQRVALGRALINRPQILLLDECLSALDKNLRQKMQEELKSLQRETKTTFIYVTHDQEEAFAMSDRVVIMNEGRVEQLGKVSEVISNPSSPFVEDFLGLISTKEIKNEI